MIQMELSPDQIDQWIQKIDIGLDQWVQKIDLSLDQVPYPGKSPQRDQFYNEF